MKKKATKKVFRTYFFDVKNIEKDVMINLLDQIAKQKIDAIRYTQNKKISVSLLKKDQKLNIYFGDLQQLHTEDLPNKVKYSGENTILKQEGFEMDEGLGYKNSFAYLSDENIIVLENNINGVGYIALNELLNSFKQECQIESRDIWLNTICDDNRYLKDDAHFEEVEFNISNFKNIDNIAFSDFNKFMQELNAQSCKIIVKNKKSFLNNDSVRNIIPFLSQNKKSLKVTKLKAMLDGENAELNFLQTKISFKNSIEIEDQNSISFDLRKEEMLKAIQYYRNYGK